MKKLVFLLLALGLTWASFATETDKKKTSATEEKVDISDLEQKYWAPKDVEFNVVQNRLYSKAGRFGITPAIVS